MFSLSRKKPVTQEFTISNSPEHSENLSVAPAASVGSHADHLPVQSAASVSSQAGSDVQNDLNKESRPAEELAPNLALPSISSGAAVGLEEDFDEAEPGIARFLAIHSLLYTLTPCSRHGSSVLC